MRVRQDKVFAVMREPANWQVRQNMVFAVISAPLFDTAIPSVTNLLALINRNVNRSVLNRDLTWDDIVADAPVVYSDEPAYNSQVTVRARPGFHFTKSITFKYNRIQLAGIFPAGGYELDSVDSTVHALLPVVNSLYGLVLDPVDIVDGPVHLTDSHLTLVAATTSPGFVPGSQFMVPFAGVTEQPLESAVTVGDLTGFSPA